MEKEEKEEKEEKKEKEEKEEDKFLPTGGRPDGRTNRLNNTIKTLYFMGCC